MKFVKSKRVIGRVLGLYVHVLNSEIQIQLDLWHLNYLIVIGEEKLPKKVEKNNKL